MGRLIDADDLIEHIKKYKFGAITNDSEREYTREVMLCFVNGISTAYNVEKVEKELIKEMNIANYDQHNVKGGAIAHGKYMAYKNSIDIVKRGGVDEC